ncbi:hypothetical protein KSB_23530 [Ktedonobacter robiniae]|uniref:Uncharacterized protein n=1 Tax=Ktedonobacter robiniae TaxID=2778365 RepID=A0ABQ3UMF8_9CHLR|nr:hypothetical protein KSB_23530 [Ktedonobacter robiniae]
MTAANPIRGQAHASIYNGMRYLALLYVDPYFSSVTLLSEEVLLYRQLEGEGRAVLTAWGRFF